MAFASAANYYNLPNGAFSPTLFSKKVQKQFRRSSVVEGITNSDYFGEIKAYGDTVRIIKEPEVVVQPYYRGTQLTSQDLEDVDFYLTIDRANYFQFQIDDIERAQAHLNWMDLASDRAAYNMQMVFDRDILGYMSGYDYNETTGLYSARSSAVGSKAESAADADELLAAHKLARGSFGGVDTDSIAVGVSGTYDTTPLGLVNRMQRLLSQQNVPEDGRFIVIDPVFEEKLMDENSKFINNDYNANQNAGGVLTNGKIMTNKIRGFEVYRSNNLPVVGGGPGVPDNNGSATDYGVIIAGHKSAIATAQTIDKTESFRSPNGFADVVRGLNMYGRKILRPQGLIRAWWNVNA